MKMAQIKSHTEETMLSIGTFNLLEVLTYVFLWTTLYFLLCLWNSNRSYEWNCRMATVIHASFISTMACYSTFVTGPWPFSDAGGVNTPLQIKTAGICLGYFLFDLSWCLYFKTEGPLMLLHHFLSIIALTWSLMTGYYGTELVATIGGAEVTNPLLQLRWFLRATGNYHTIWGDIVDFAFMVSFGTIRLGAGSVLLYYYYQQPTTNWGRFGGTTIYIISWMFFIGIAKYAVHKYTKRRAASHKKEQSGSQSVHSNGEVKEDVSSVGIIREKELPSSREIKDIDGELTLRKNCLIKEEVGDQ